MTTDRTLVDREEFEDQPDELPPDNAAQQDFAARNVIMPNPVSGASSVAGAVIASEGDLEMQPQTDEELAEESKRQPD